MPHRAPPPAAGRPGSSPTRTTGSGGPSPTAITETLRAVEDVQGACPDLGWPEASNLADALVDHIAHLLIDLADGLPEPRRRPMVAGAIGSGGRPADHASCQAAAAALRRAAAVFTDQPQPLPWSGVAASVTGELADLLEQVAHRSRTGRTLPSDKGVVLRRLHGLQRRFPGSGP